MAASVAAFVTRFPEFSSRSVPQITATLAAVELRVAASYGVLRDEVVYYTLAEALTSGQQGRPTRKGAEGKTSYAAKLEEFRQIHALDLRVGR